MIAQGKKSALHGAWVCLPISPSAITNCPFKVVMPHTRGSLRRKKRNCVPYLRVWTSYGFDVSWRFNSSGWQLTDGCWCIAKSGWCITDSGWQLTDGVWGLANGGCWVTRNKWVRWVLNGTKNENKPPKGALSPYLDYAHCVPPLPVSMAQAIFLLSKGALLTRGAIFLVPRGDPFDIRMGGPLTGSLVKSVEKFFVQAFCSLFHRFKHRLDMCFVPLTSL